MPVRLPRSLAALGVLAALAGPALAGPRDELLRHVPDDCGFCLVVSDLRGKSADVLASPFAGLWRRSAVGKSVAGAAELAQLGKADDYLRKHLGVGWQGLRDDLLGEAFAFAYRPGPPGKPEQEQGLFLLRAGRARTLADLVARLNELQKKTGELKALQPREHRGVAYVRRVEGNGTHYYLLRGPVLLFSGQEAMLQAAIDRDRTLPVDAEPPVARRLRELGAGRALAAVLINPRAFDAAVTARATDGPGKAFAAYWKALGGVAVALHLERDVRLTLTAQAKTAELPPAARRFLAASAGGSEVWAGFPDDALFAAGSRLDLAALYEALAEFSSPSSRQGTEAELARGLGAMLGKDVIKELLPALGPDWGVCVTAPPAGGQSWVPRVLLALKVARGGDVDPVDQAVLSAVHGWAQLAVLGHNKHHPGRPIALKATTVDGVRVRHLAGEAAFPAGVQPAFALKDGYLVLASSPAELRRFRVKASAGPVPLLRVSVRSWRGYLGQRRAALVAALAAKEGVSRDAAAAKLDGLAATLEMIDHIELTQKAAAGQVTFELLVRPAQPLKK